MIKFLKNFCFFKSRLRKQILNDSNCRAQRIIQNDAQFSLIPWECNDENAVLSLCVGVYVDEQLTTIFFTYQNFQRPIIPLTSAFLSDIPLETVSFDFDAAICASGLEFIPGFNSGFNSEFDSGSNSKSSLQDVSPTLHSKFAFIIWQRLNSRKHTKIIRIILNQISQFKLQMKKKYASYILFSDTTDWLTSKLWISFNFNRYLRSNKLCLVLL